MSYRNLFKFFVMVIIILTVNLISSYIDNYFQDKLQKYNPFYITLVGMLVIVLIFYPLFSKFDKFIGDFAKKFLKEGTMLFGSKVGIFAAFIIAFIVLWYFYAKIWFGINIFFIFFQKMGL